MPGLWTALDDLVPLSEPDPRWPEWSDQERRRLHAALVTASTPVAIAHIGSTAVAGLPARPVIDLMLGTDAFPPSDGIVARLQLLGYEALGAEPEEGRLHYRRRTAPAFALQVLRHGGTHWSANLALRDYLRAHPEARDAYAQAKRDALAASPRSAATYRRLVTPVLEGLKQRSQAWWASRSK
jgi:GrpB-like predicted nucleotidyltransferase (UPF0157 family)